MTDWEKVIKGLEEVQHYIKIENLPAHTLKAKLVIDDAIALLKAQEPKHGQWITKQRHEHYPSGKPYEADYCSVCGKRGSIEYPSCPWSRAIMDNSQVDKLTEAAQWK